MFFQLQQAISSTTTGLPFPHLVGQLVKGLRLKPDTAHVEDTEFADHFMPQDVEKLRDFANISYVPPPPPKMLSLPAPAQASKKPVKEEGACGSQAHKPLLRSGIDLEIRSKLDSLNDNLSGLKEMLHERLSALIVCLENSLTQVLKAAPPAQE